MAATKTPQIRGITRDNLVDVARDIKGILDVREGYVGDPLDANVTYRDLVDVGALALRPGSKSGGGGRPVIPAWVLPDGYDPAKDLTPPPKPEGFTATGLFAMVQLQWDRPTYRNHAYTEIWRSETNSLGNAVLIGTSDTSFYADSLGASATRYYWVRFVSQADVKGPYNATEGTQASTAQDPGLLLESLSGQINESHLYSSLASRIDLIDGPETLQDSVAARIAAEAQARSLAITAEALARTQAISDEAAARSNGLIAEALARTSEITQASSSLQSQIDLLSASSSGDIGQLISVVKSEEQSRVSGDSVLSGVTSTLISISGSNAAGIQTQSQAIANSQASQASQISVLLAASQDSKATIASEQNARASADAATASQLNGLLVQSGGSVAGLVTERNTSATSDAALSSQIGTLVASTGSTAAAITTTQIAQAQTDSAIASQISNLNASVGTAAAAIELEQEARATADASFASQASSLAASLGSNNSAIVVEQSARATSDSSISSQVVTSLSRSDQNTAALIVEQLTRSNETSALSSQTSSLSALSATNAASIELEQEARTSADASISSNVLTLAATAGNTSAGLQAEQSVRSTETGSLATQSLSLSALAGANLAGLQTEQNARASADEASARISSTLAANAGATAASISSLSNVSATQDAALASQVTSTASATGSSVAAIKSEETARTTQFGAISTIVTTLQSGLGSNTASIQQETQVRANETGSLFAQYTVKTDLAGRVAGFGLASETTVAGANTSQFGIVADRFFVAAPNDYVQETTPTVGVTAGKVWYRPSTKTTLRYDGTQWVAFNPIVPFVVQATPTTVGSVTVPAGVYMDAAFIKNATITGAKIQDAAIDNAKIANIDATKITTGFLSADRISAGSIDATKIDTRGLDIRDANNNIVFSSGSGVIARSNASTMIQYPGGGSISSDQPSQAGALWIILPQAWTNTMLRFDVEIYEYSTGAVQTYTVGGYTYFDTNWYNQFATYTGDPSRSRRVTFGVDGPTGRPVIAIGTFAGSWAYPKITIRNLMVGYSNYSSSQWNSGWSLSFQTSRGYTERSVILSPRAGGAFSALDQITPENVSTFIASAAIGTAQIEDASITNAKIVSLEASKISATSLSAISANLGAVTAGSISINSRFIVDTSGNTTIRSSTSGARMEIQNNVIKVFDSSGVLRVQIGDLSA